MKKRIYLSAVILIALIFASLSCSPQKRFSRLVKKHPELIDTTVTVDTVVVNDSILIRTTNYIRETEIDSILVECTTDTVIRDRIKYKILDRCTIESAFGGNTHIRKLENGTVKVKAIGNNLEIELETYNTEKEVIRYIKCEECHNWRWYFYGIASLFLLLLLIVFILTRL